MQRSQDELYAVVSDLRTKTQFTKEITKRYQAYGGLLDKDTIAFLLVDELGRNTYSLTSINDLKDGTDATVRATVRSVSDVKTFRKKNGTTGKVLNLEISDDTAACRLVLWNEDIEQVKAKDIRPGSRIRVVNGYTKTSYTGLELNLGRWGLLEVENPEPPPVPPSEDTSSLAGILLSREATKAFFKDTGDFGFTTTITLQATDGTTRPVTLWDASVKTIQDIQLGETIILRRLEKKTTNGTEEWHLTTTGTIERTLEKPHATRPPTTPR